MIKRHGDGDIAKRFTERFMKYQDFFETKGESEENTYEIIVSPEMSPENVAQKILETANYTA